jgi:membrane protease YdiL (CAAX protease family)
MSMIMVTVGTFIAGRYVFRDGFARAGWRWGTRKQYALAFALVALIWVVPVVLERALGLQPEPSGTVTVQVIASFLLFFTLTLVPGFGEEFGWRGYMLRHLADRHSVRRALVLHGFIWWAWHLPTIVGIALQTTDIAEGPIARVAIMLGFSLIPSMMNGVIYAYVWASTQSLAVATAFHSAFDETRDTLESTVGFGPFVDLYWQNGLLTLLGAFLLWKGNWKNLTRRPAKPIELRPGTDLDTRKAG